MLKQLGAGSAQHAVHAWRRVCASRWATIHGAWAMNIDIDWVVRARAQVHIGCPCTKHCTSTHTCVSMACQYIRQHGTASASLHHISPMALAGTEVTVTGLTIVRGKN